MMKAEKMKVKGYRLSNFERMRGTMTLSRLCAVGLS